MTPGIPMATAASSLLQLPTGHKEVPHPPRKALVRFNCTENILLKSFPMLTTGHTRDQAQNGPWEIPAEIICIPTKPVAVLHGSKLAPPTI